MTIIVSNTGYIYIQGFIQRGAWNIPPQLDPPPPPQDFEIQYDVIIIKRASGASEVFSLMKTNNCLRIRVLTRNACLHLAYASSTGVVSAPGEYVFALIEAQIFQPAPPSLGYAHKISCAYYPVLKSIKQNFMRLPSRVEVH